MAECSKKCCLFVLILSIILYIIYGLGAISPLHYGLICNSISKKCDNKKVYEGGRYFIGITNYFLDFPSFLQTIEFSLNKQANAPPLSSRT